MTQLLEPLKPGLYYLDGIECAKINARGDLVELAKMVKSFYGDARWITNATPEQRFAEEGRLLELARAALAKAEVKG